MKAFLLCLALLVAFTPASAQNPPSVLVRLDRQMVPTQFANIAVYNQHVAQAKQFHARANTATAKIPLYLAAAAASAFGAYKLYRYGEEQDFWETAANEPTSTSTVLFAFGMSGLGTAGVFFLFMPRDLLEDRAAFKQQEQQALNNARALYPNLNVNR